MVPLFAIALKITPLLLVEYERLLWMLMPPVTVLLAVAALTESLYPVVGDAVPMPRFPDVSSRIRSLPPV